MSGERVGWVGGCRAWCGVMWCGGVASQRQAAHAAQRGPSSFWHSDCSGRPSCPAASCIGRDWRRGLAPEPAAMSLGCWAWGARKFLTPSLPIGAGACRSLKGRFNCNGLPRQARSRTYRPTGAKTHRPALPAGDWFGTRHAAWHSVDIEHNARWLLAVSNYYLTKRTG